MCFNVCIRYRQKPGGETGCCCYRTLFRISIETYSIVFRLIVFRKQPFCLQPFPEVLPHDGLQHPTPHRQLTRVRGPRKPGMGCDITQQRPAAGHRRTDIVTAQNHNLVQGVLNLSRQIRRNLFCLCPETRNAQHKTSEKKNHKKVPNHPVFSETPNPDIFRSHHPIKPSFAKSTSVEILYHKESSCQ